MTTIDEFKEIMLNAPIDEKWDVLSQIEQTPEMFHALIQLLKTPNDRTQFMVLFTLIRKFSDQLSNPDDELVEQVLKLLNHENFPIRDRAMWALSIMGKKGLEPLLKIAQSDDLKWKELAIWAMGRNANLHLKKEETIQVLLSALVHEHDEIKYAAMNTLMNLRPAKYNEYYVLRDFDYTRMYAAIKPVAAYFTKSENDSISEWAGRYNQEIIEWEKSNSKEPFA